MKKTCWSGGLAVCLAVFAFNTHAVTIDFQLLEHNDASQTIVPGVGGDTYTEDGFTLSSTTLIAPLYSYGTDNNNYRGSTGLHIGLQGRNTSLTANNGSAFNLVSIDLGEQISGEAKVVFTGHLLGGGTVTQSFTLDGVFSFGSGFETFFFSGFNNITSLEWSNESPLHQFDDIVVSTVPLPAAVWLFGLGLLGLLGVARRRTY